MRGPTLWMKAVYTVALAGGSIWLSTLLGRPGMRALPALIALALIFGAAVVWSGAELATAPADQRIAVWRGGSSSVCGLNILLASLFAARLVFLSARRLALTRPATAGAALGAGDRRRSGDSLWPALHRGDGRLRGDLVHSGAATAGALGAIIGRVALRW